MQHYHFIGIKGSGMSGLAQLLHDRGHRVQGSDTEERLFTQEGLEQRGIALYPMDGSSLREGQTVIIGNAFGEQHDEVKKAKEMGLSCIRYPDFLSSHMNQSVSIGISGSHGKTSTTSLLSHVFGSVKEVSYLIGDGTGRGAKDEEYFVFEACEYKRHFLAYRPDYAVITNIDFDHPDYFKNLADTVDAFSSFAGQAKKAVLVCGDSKEAASLSPTVPLFTYGLSDGCRFQAKNVDTLVAFTAFDVYDGEVYKGRILIRQHGKHAVQNALAVAAICLLEGSSLESCVPAFASFRGANRRFKAEEWQGGVVVDDYAHHPAEIQATIDAARQRYPHRKVIAIFQPHTYSRTEVFREAFREALSLADEAFECPVFASAREAGEGRPKYGDVAAGKIDLSSMGVLKKHRRDVLLFMGAGDITRYIDAYKEGIV